MYRDERESLRLRIAALERRLDEQNAVGVEAEAERRRLEDEVARLVKLWEMHAPETRRLWPWLLALVLGLFALATLAAWLKVTGPR